jgi:hypothetical protein
MFKTKVCLFFFNRNHIFSLQILILQKKENIYSNKEMCDTKEGSLIVQVIINDKVK